MFRKFYLQFFISHLCNQVTVGKYLICQLKNVIGYEIIVYYEFLQGKNNLINYKISVNIINNSYNNIIKLTRTIGFRFIL